MIMRIKHVKKKKKKTLFYFNFLTAKIKLEGGKQGYKNKDLQGTKT